MHPRTMWELSNQPRLVEPHTLRLALGALTAVYAAIVIARLRVGQPWPCELARAVLVTYAALGFLFLPRAGWRAIRAYSAVLAPLFSLGVGLTHAMLGNSLALVPVTGVATFVTLLLLQTGRDFLVVLVVEAVGHALVLWLVPTPPLIPLRTVAAILGVNILVGEVAGLTLLIYRISLHQSLCSLEEALRAKSEFLNTMSHELRSPLHVILGYAEMLRERTTDGEAIGLIERIGASAFELLHLVETTMQVARLEAGKLPLHLQDFAPGELVGELRENVGALPEAKSGVPVHWEVATDVPAVRLDRLKLKEIVQNLVSNALKFTRRGCVAVAVSVEEDRLRIAVRDTGPGIPPGSQARIFEMFERIDEPGAPRAPGIGLGLYIVRSLVQLMEGDIQVASRVGEGTCFTVRLPLRLPEAA